MVVSNIQAMCTLLTFAPILIAAVRLIFFIFRWAIDSTMSPATIDMIINITFNRYSLVFYFIVIMLIHGRYFYKAAVTVINMDRQFNTYNLHSINKNTIRLNAERLAFSRNFNRNIIDTSRYCNGPNHDKYFNRNIPAHLFPCGYYLLPCGHILCDPCKINQQKPWNPLCTITCPVQECINQDSPYLSEDYVFHIGNCPANLINEYIWRHLSNQGKYHQNSLIDGYIRREEQTYNIMVPTVINKLIYKHGGNLA